MATTVKVTAPVRSYNGTVGYGENSVTFKDGEAEVPTDSPHLRYFREAGYGVGSKEPQPPSAPEVEYPDPSNPRIEYAPLRDAAVDPRPEDFLEPINAGKAHPHSPEVVSPGIHAVGPAPIRPGEVHVDDVAAQDRAEKELARKVLIEGEPATIVDEHFDPGETAAGEAGRRGRVTGGNMGPLGLSDPGSVEQGIEDAADVRASAPAGPPGKGAKKAAWVDWAVSQGADRDAAEDLKIADLRERYPVPGA